MDQIFQWIRYLMYIVSCDVVVLVDINGDFLIVYLCSSSFPKHLSTKRTFIELAEDDKSVMSGVYVRTTPIGKHSRSI